MADNVTADPGSGGSVFATDDIGGVHYTINKITFGALDSQTLASSGAGNVDAGTQRVVIASDQAVVSIDDNNGSLTVDNAGTFAVQSTLQAGTAEIGKLAAGIAEIGNIKNSGTFAVQAAQSGTWDVANISGVVSLPTGAATAAKQLADGHNVTVDNASITVDNTGTFAVQIDGINGTVDANNNTSIPLGGEAVFTGTSTDILQFTGITISVFTDVASAIDGLSVQFSADATNWDHLDVFTIPAGTGKTFSFQPVARYMRIVYTNGGSAQSTFRLSTILKTQPGKPSSHRIADSISSQDDAEVVKAVLTGENPSNQFVNFQATTAGNFKVSLEESNGNITGPGTEATALRVTMATDSTGLLSIDDNGGSLTVDNSGTFATQATLQAGSAAIGKLAANSGVDIGDVDILSIAAGTNLIGKMSIDQVTANANEVVTKTGSLVQLEAGTAGIGKLTANSGVDIGDVDVTSISAGSNLIGDIGLSGARTSGGTTLYKNIDVDESEDEVKATAGQVYWIQAINTTASIIYLKFYNATTGTVVVGTTVPDLTFPVPGDTAGAGFTLSVPNGIEFGTAITIAATTGVADADSGAPGTNALIVNLGFA